MAIPMLIFKGFTWAKENGQEEEYCKQYEEYFGVKFKGVCPICNKLKPPGDWTPFSNECDAGYDVTLDNGSKHPGYCDSKRFGLQWPPEGFDIDCY